MTSIQAFMTFWLSSTIAVLTFQTLFRWTEKEETPIFPAFLLMWVVVLGTALQFGGFWK